MPTTVEARTWLDRWDRQQERYIADREERFAVIGDVVASVGAVRPKILDVGCGPGSLSVRLLERFPGAEVVGVDADPLLLGLATAAYGDRRGLHFIQRDLRLSDWHGQFGWQDAVVSTTALHWLTRDELASVYRACAGLLRPGGVLVNGDHLASGARLNEIAERVRDARDERAGVLDNEEWQVWSSAVGEAPELASLVGERGARPLDHSVPDVPSLDDHVTLLGDAGFAEVGTVWQVGTDRVLVAVR